MAEIDFRREFGPRCDGSDEGDLLSDAIRLCQSRRADLLIEGAGCLGYSKNIDLSGLSLKMSGQFVLKALNPASSALRITGANTGLFGGRIISPGTTARSQSSNAAGVYIVGANNFVVDGVSVEGVAAAGFHIEKATAGRLRNTTATRTRADGHHITGASSNILLENCKSVSTGDDGFAVVSYRKDGAKCRSIRFNNVSVMDSSARGCAVVGGEDIEFNGFSVDGAAAAGVYIFGEKPYNTFSPSNVRFRNGSIINTDRALFSHQGGVLVGDTNGERPDNILLENISIGRSAGASVTAVRVGTGARILLRSINVRDSSGCAVLLNGADVQLDGLKSQNIAASLIQIAKASGKLVMTNIVSKNAFQSAPGASGYLIDMVPGVPTSCQVYLDGLQNLGPEGKGVVDPQIAAKFKRCTNVFSNYRKIY